AVLDPLRDESRLVGIVVERRGGSVQDRQRRRVEQRLNTGVALRDVDDIAVDVVDGASDELSEIRSQYQGASRRIRVLDGGDLLIVFIDDDVGMQMGEIVDRG